MNLSAPASVDLALARAREGLCRLSPMEAHAAAASDGLIIDIRSEKDRESMGVVPGAHFVPRNVLEWRADPTSPYKDPRLVAVRGPLILMCSQGYQSSFAAAALVTLMGVANATDLIGGFERWREEGLPIHGPSDALGSWPGGTA